MEEEFKSILERARNLSKQVSLRSLSVDELCIKLGINRSTLLKYSKTKRDLVESLLFYERESFQSIFVENDFCDTNAIDILFIVSREVCKRFTLVTPSVTFDLQKYYPAIYRNHVEERSQYIFEKIKINLEKGIRQGMYRSDLSVELVARLYISRLLDLHNPEYFPPERFSFPMLFEVMFENFVRSVATPEGLVFFENRKNEIDFAL
ncbi:MAG: hypothetical protein A2X11_02820 [Bacteroidetes bacterium GWE2_42_24]|nr:MAG: hypothetical protein A2X11_02820 [Bacteroidetes bacterium GWE2_42_24]OFY28866.1 MAG: hypothetical protein A2X09_12315 [Bacteroidetes bacterium GWF2_43_11]